MRTTKFPLMCVIAVVASGSAAVTHSQDKSAPGISFPALPGGMPFIAVGPQPREVPVNSEDWRSVVAEYGAPMAGRQAKIVEDIVAEISRAAGNVAPKGGYRGTLLDSSTMNAFAIGDGNTFVTRQLLASMNDEDELIGVMGHEVGHVIGGHPAFSGAAGSVKAKGDQLLGVFLPGLAEGAQLGGTVILRGFGRAQEHSSDVAGVKFLADLGRDPMAMGHGLALLEAHSKLQEKMFGARPPNALDYWLRTHPVNSERIGMVRLTASMAPRGKPGPRRSRETFVRELDGLLFDDGPQQGIVDGSRFRHPVMKYGLDAPPSFRLLNGSSSLSISAPGGSAATLRMVSGGGAPVERLKAIWARSFKKEIAVPNPVAVEISGMPAASGHTELTIEGVSVRFSMWLYAWSDSQSIIYVAVDPKGAQANQHAAAAQSFRRLSEEEAAAVRVRRIKVVDVASSDTVAGLSARMAYGDFREERFRLINGLFNGEPLPKSGPVKVVVWSAQ
jgi:predicted Zn-dependent protease